jgi:anti-sigma factor (TIGR02949 family)
MTCRDAIELLADYLEAELPPETGDRLAVHLAGCQPCQAYLNTYRRTRDVTRAAGRVEMPEEMRARLRGFLLERLRDTA